ncbi:hypothetical protein RYX36_009390 [Vicia faba]
MDKMMMKYGNQEKKKRLTSEQMERNRVSNYNYTSESSEESLSSNDSFSSKESYGPDPMQHDET